MSKNLEICFKWWAHAASVKLVWRIDIIEDRVFLVQLITFALGKISFINLI